ncbi:MAG: hypothetical protein ACKVP0_24630 [Pirellulaceae bacterium]
MKSLTQNPSCLGGASVIALFGLLALATDCAAVVPEPGNIYYGLARNIYGQVLTPDSGAQVIMVRTSTTNEFVMAVSEILPIPDNGPEVNYILRPSLDDGVGPRYVNEAGRTNEVVQIYVVQAGFRFPVTNTPGCIAFSDPIPRMGGRGALANVGIKANDDFDLDCLSDAWEIQYFGNTADGNPASDDDFDGYSNLAEYLMGTNPNDAASNPGNVGVLEITGVAPNAVRFRWPRFLGVPDALQWSSRVDGVYTNVPANRVSGTSSIIVDTTGQTNLFFRVRYQPQQ